MEGVKKVSVRNYEHLRLVFKDNTKSVEITANKALKSTLDAIKDILYNHLPNDEFITYTNSIVELCSSISKGIVTISYKGKDYELFRKRRRDSWN